MDECFECSGTGVAERIGGYDRPCDVCRGDGRLPPMTNPKHTDTSRSGDLVERLRGDKYTCRENMGCGTMEFCACATMEDAADRIEALTAEVERLREALAMCVAEMMRASGRLEIIATCNEDRRIVAALSGTCDYVRSALGGSNE